MSLLENIRLAISGLKTSKMRALLTMLGIIIGIGSVIAIVTIGNSMTSSVTDSMSSMGIQNINVSLRQSNSASRGPGQEARIDDADLISEAMIEDLMEIYADDIVGVSLTQSAGSGSVKDGSLYANISLTGVNPYYEDANSVTVQDGRFIMDRDVDGRKRVAVVSDKLVNNIFGEGADALEKEIKVYTGNQIMTFMIIGVYEYQSSGFMQESEQDIRTDIYIPVSTAKRLANAASGYQSFTLIADGDSSPTAVAGTVESYFSRYYPATGKYTVSANSMESMLESMTDMMSTISLAIAAIAAISLIVGGIGVMNIMLVSVTERTREIGTRKALGARSSAIRMQFVVESIFICMIGGLIGVIVGIILGRVGASLLGYPASVSMAVCLIAVAFSMVIGVFFGYYPAGKAAKLDPIEALRYE